MVLNILSKKLDVPSSQLGRWSLEAGALSSTLNILSKKLDVPSSQLGRWSLRSSVRTDRKPATDRKPITVGILTTAQAVKSKAESANRWFDWYQGPALDPDTLQ